MDELNRQIKDEKVSDEEAKKTDIGWGYQIRSYVLQPYQMVKDLRNKIERSDTEKVLNGDIDSFLEAQIYNLDKKEKKNV